MAILPPGPVVESTADEALIEGEGLAGTRERPYLVTKAISYADPDRQFDHLIQTVSTKVVDVDAKLLESDGRVVHYRSVRDLLARSKDAQRRVREHYSAKDLKDLNTRLVEASIDGKLVSKTREKKLREDFSQGLYPDETASNSRTFSLQDTILPTSSTPASKQMLLVDYMDSHVKCWEAATRNPIGKRISHLIPEFVLGRGVVGATRNKRGQQKWDAFHEDNDMRMKLRTILRELVMYGEVFLRYFPVKGGQGLQLRSVDPSTIWDIITDPDDIETVRYYHQQYVILNNTPVPVSTGHLAPSTLVIRHIKAAEIDHFKINSTSSEKRGRSELEAILGWLLRFKEFANDRVLLNKMRAMFALDVSVDGDATDVAQAEAQFARPPGSGAVVIHNKRVEIDFKNANNNANEAKTDADMILKIIAIGAGISEQFLGVSSASTRAGALLQTEPDVKRFETYQEIVESILSKAWRRVRNQYAIPVDTKMEFTFPSLASEQRTVKLKDLAFMEAMDYISKARAATAAAKEMGITTYDFKEEQGDIERERRDGGAVMATGMQQVQKIAPDPGAETTPPGLGPDLTPGTPDKLPHMSAQMGYGAKMLSGREMADTAATLGREDFSPGEEKAGLRTNRSNGVRVRASAGGAEQPPPRTWSEMARTASLLTRLRKKVQRLEEVAAQPEEGASLHEQERAELQTRIVDLERKLDTLRSAPKIVERRLLRDGDGRVTGMVETHLSGEDS